MMSQQNAELAATLVPKTYIQQGMDSLRSREQLVARLLSNRTLPKQGWDDLSIDLLLNTLAAMDSNNFRGNAGAGEREARVFSSMVAKRHFGLCHGIGRSGDIAAVQPKAAGSSIMVQLTNILGKTLLQQAGAHTSISIRFDLPMVDSKLNEWFVSGLPEIKSALVLPVATGMSMTLVFLTLKQQKPDAQYVIWPRIDQKSCFKAILAACLTPLVVQNVLEGDELRTNMKEIRRLIDAKGPESILCVMSTTSCFAPRGYDRVDEIAEICQDSSIAHVINNAYGTQSRQITKLITRAQRKGRVDAIVQSLDKNYMVPVGGALVGSGSVEFIDQLAKLYPGRASNTPIVDFFITALQMGSDGYTALLRGRNELVEYFKSQLTQLASDLGERVLQVDHNEISFGMTLDALALSQQGEKGDGDSRQALTFLGAMLFSRGVSGARVISTTSHKIIANHEFIGFGASYDTYPSAYMTLACAIGVDRAEIDDLFKKLRKTFQEWTKRKQKHKQTKEVGPPQSNARGESSKLLMMATPT